MFETFKIDFISYRFQSFYENKSDALEAPDAYGFCRYEATPNWRHYQKIVRDNEFQILGQTCPI